MRSRRRPGFQWSSKAAAASLRPPNKSSRPDGCRAPTVLLGRRVLAAGLWCVHALRPALLVLETGDARPGSLVLVLDLDVQRAKPLAGKLNLVAIHERVQSAMVGAGGQDIAGQQRV